MTQPARRDAHLNLYEDAPLNAAPATASLSDGARSDICVIGAGFTGLGAALTLAEGGADVLVVEASRIGGGASGVNGGQIHPGQRRDQGWLEAKVGEAEAMRLWQFAEEARRWLQDRIARHGIVCDLEPGLLSLAHRRDIAEGMRADAFHMANRYGVAGLEVLTEADLPRYTGAQGYCGGLFDPHGGHLDPLALTRGLAAAAAAAGARIAEDTTVRRVVRDGTGWRLETSRGAVSARVVVATGDGSIGNLLPEVAAHVVPIVNFMVATSPLGDRAKTVLRERYAASDTKFVVNYFKRTVDDRLVFGGGESYGNAVPADIRSRVQPRMLKVFPDLADVPLTHAWGGRLGITATRLPFVRRLRPDLYVASGFSGQGVMIGPYTGVAIAEAIGGRSDRFDLMARLPIPRFPGGPLLRRAIVIAAMVGAGLVDRL
ncbi:NAD(P)/FAD-dependent oxidoreductase [Chelatococcus asaccharovorans]|uniref:NAD(P)/FAD-dependent oxidoreductase n=1 Tax=Chelatococcus asaccharovorans TaxID=28210 RepID=UPI00224C6937|nr:FAD-binding oxidoreductase [Chelatococcus asaccharovorans]CAH1672549.1 Gamma-glutamylputrescine oxidase [Chelatococcus asaccharovorans]CAH1676036.1 Gamma-glutamylputrescine oxidase [Chelatococcus asaccharovorans]